MWLACLTVTLLLIFISISAADIISPLTYSVLEEADPGDFRVVIPLDSGLSAMYGEDAVQMMTFAFSDDAAPHLDLFDLDNNGVLTTTSSIDRDVMCEHQPDCTVDLSIRVQSDEVFHILQVVITVEDTNDNEPVFSDSVVSTSLSESSSPGSMFTIPAASDPDSPQYTINRYQLVSGEADFSLVVNNDSPVWTQEVIYLSLLNHLDREQQDKFTIQVMAVDGSGQSDTLTVDILITDVNDNNPEFLRDSYSVTVDENLTGGSKIIQVEATDPDAGDNGVILYQFSTKTLTDFGSVFSVDSSTGEVSLVGDLDHEIRDSYTLTVTANNLSPGSLPDITQVEIKVNDLNDNAPDIRLVTNDQDDVVHLSETKAPGSFVAHVRVTDEDSGVNGQFECVLNHPVFELEKLFDTEFKIVTKKSLDREDEHMYDLWVYCKDKGESPQANSEYITVVIDDDNDNAPSFPKEKYETRVRENSDKLTLIQVKATDPDEGENGRVSLQLESNVGNILEINEDTGLISAKEPLDREQYSQLAFNVIARDHGQPAMTSSVQVVIIIEDEDDNDPTFALKAYTLNVNEHLPPYSEVGQVEAVDGDSDVYNKFTYDLRMSNEQENVFIISYSNGTIYTLAELDREERGSYNVVVVATSYNTNRPVTNNAVVTIIVGDVNDFKPVFKFPSPSNNTFAITSDHQVGQEILTLKAEDRDSGESGEITYVILSGNEERYITLSADNGTLILNKDLSRLGDHLFALLLRVEDIGVPVRSSEATLNLLVRASGVPDDKDGLVSNRNLTVVIVIGCITGVIVVILLVTVVALLRRRHLQKHRKQNRRSMLNIIVEQKPADDDPGSGLSFTNESLPRRSSTQKMATSIDRLYNGNHYQNHGVDNPECPTEGSHKDQHGDRSGQKSSQLYEADMKSGTQPFFLHHSSHGSTSGQTQPLCEDLHRYRLMYGNQALPPPVGRESGDKDSDSGCSADMSHSTDGGKPGHHDHKATHNIHSLTSPPPKPPKLPLKQAAPVHRPPPPCPESSSLREEVPSERQGFIRGYTSHPERPHQHSQGPHQHPRGPHQHPQGPHKQPLGPPPPYVPRKNRQSGGAPAPTDNAHKHRPNPALSNAVTSILKSPNTEVLFVGNPEEVHV